MENRRQPILRTAKAFKDTENTRQTKIYQIRPTKRNPIEQFDKSAH
jgi:hypothetical protein